MKQTHSFRSKLGTAKLGAYTFKVDAMYWPGSDPRPVCALCWSRLDPEWGKGHTGPTLDDLKGKCSETSYKDKTGEEWLIWEEHFRCCNPDCDVAALVRYLPAKLSFTNPYHPEDVKTFKIKAPKWKTGKYLEDGVFVYPHKGGWEPVKRALSSREVKVEYDYPWIYLQAGELADEVPPNWTTVVDEAGTHWIKTNINSKRFKDIRKWFAERRVRLEDLVDDDTIFP